MAVFVKKQRDEILHQALQAVVEKTPITARSAGSVARSIVESITTEIADLYDVLDYNISQSVISTASGYALDNIGLLYGVRRDALTQFDTIDSRTGSFYFYIDAPHVADITIPSGARVYTETAGFIGQQIFFTTDAAVTIVAGKTKAYASLRLGDGSLMQSVGADRLVRTDVASIVPGITIKCTNPKAIAATQSRENDNDFRQRIIKAIRVSAAGTVDAIRFSILAIPGVRDVMIRSATFGLGSIELVVVPRQGFNAKDTVDKVGTALREARPAGITVHLTTPNMIAFDLSIRLMLTSGISAKDSAAIAARAEIAIRIYLNSLLPGEAIVYNVLMQKILESSDLIKDVFVSSYAPNGTEAVRRNYVPGATDQIIPGTIKVSWGEGQALERTYA